MKAEEELIPLEEAKQQVALVCRRLGLLHLAFARVMERELGEHSGRKLTGKAIKEYGRLIGEKKRARATEAGLPLTPEGFNSVSDLPSIGMHTHVEEVEIEGETRYRAHNCVMGRIWQECGADGVGQIYCLVDPASSMAFNPEHKLIHTMNILEGDPYCELVIRATSEKDRQSFADDDTDWDVIEERS
jgi:hypothetical protein